jgi:hypothetical protein
MMGSLASIPHVGAEERLLCGLLSRILVHAPHAELVFDGVDWTRFLRLVQRHRVGPSTFRILARHPEIVVPPDVTTTLKLWHDRNALANLRGSVVLVELAEILARHGVVMLPLKGVSLALRTYGDLAARHSGDLDVLVAPADLMRADRVLRETGWTRISNKTHEEIEATLAELPLLSHHLSYRRHGSPALELHFELNPNPRLLPLDIAAAAAKGTRAMIGGHALALLPDGPHLLFLATHGARHNWKRLIWLLDVAVMVDRTDAATVDGWIAEAERLGVAGPLAQGLALAHATLALPLPERIRPRLGSFAVRYMTKRAAGFLFRSLDEEPDEVTAGFDLSIRLYRMCMSPRFAYHWQELVRGGQAVTARLTGRGVDP